MADTQNINSLSNCTANDLANARLLVTLASGETINTSIDALSAKILPTDDKNAIFDGVFIMYHRKSDNIPLMVKPWEWTAQQNAGEIADGVVVCEGGHILVVAPTGTPSTGLLWSSAAVSGGATTTTDRVTAMNDWNGKANTASIISKSTTTAVTNTADYAPGFCNKYERKNANGQGLTAGKWWLPSVGEMMMIYANRTKINHCLSLITGAQLLTRDWYWTSTEHSSTNVWFLHLTGGLLTNWGTKASSRHRVRPVSTFIP